MSGLIYLSLGYNNKGCNDTWLLLLLLFPQKLDLFMSILWAYIRADQK